MGLTKNNSKRRREARAARKSRGASGTPHPAGNRASRRHQPKEAKA